MDEGSVGHQKMLDHVDVEGVADGSGLIEVEEGAKGLIRRQRRSSIREAHEAFSFDAAERAQELMSIVDVDEFGKTASCTKR